MTSPRSYVVDMRSDTLTKPTDSMRKAMANAVVGDDIYEEDPTVIALQRKLAEIMGKQAALFVPTGTMANTIAVMVHCNKRGADVILGDKSHIFKYEQGSICQMGNVCMTTVKNREDGTFDLEDVEDNIKGKDIHETTTMLIAVENTHNYCGGKVLPMAWLDQLSVFAKKHSLPLHMDGARIFNAAHYLGIEPAEIVKNFDSVSVCFSKGLGAPVGSAIVGSFSFIRQARYLRKAFGGAMRQVGVIAAPAYVALDEVVPALVGDHRRAKHIGEAINAMRSTIFSVDVNNIHTNMVMVNISKDSDVHADKVVERLTTIMDSELNQKCVTDEGEAIAVRILSMSPKRLRITTYFQITDTDINYAIKKMTLVFKEMEPKKGFFG